MQAIFARYFLPAPSPPIQAISIFVSFLVVVLLSKIVGYIGWISPGEKFPWVLAGSFILLFSMFNSVLFLNALSPAKYYRNSIYSFAGLAVLSGLSAYLISGLSLSEAGSFRWIFLVLTVGYIVFLSIVGAMKAIMELAKQKDTRNFDGRRHRLKR
ncbi:MAG: hypothetical protein IPI60_09250 [Saprospiraceae bacterium]|nr:hypothetical protein [Saprospiraceae bacterium]